ncbi:MAG TPA: ABC transporter ATP-binding protein, partial [Microthrixaceae bacterium]|nr:ABC transporter ATP-binding protein [Microthrixaceae bacterium]
MPQSPTNPTGAAVEVRNLVIRYGELLAVNDVSFSANSGEITVVLGPNGAGKTSTIEHLEGFRSAASGSAKVLGLDPIADHQELSFRVGIMLQNGGIPTAIRPYELLRQYSGFFEDPLDPEALLGIVGLENRRATPYRRLSGGEQQRLSLALALIGQPELVFLD